MKNTSLLRNILFTAVLSIMLTGCGGGKDYRNMLPNDSFIIMSMNLKSLKEKANMGDPAQNPLYKLIDNSLNSDKDLSEVDRAYMLSIITNPGETGIDDASDCFIFMKMKDMNRMEAGMLFKIKDLKKFEKLVDFAVHLGFDKKAENGFNLLGINLGTDGPVIAYNNEGVMIFAAQNSFEQNIARITELFNQKADHSLLANKEIVKALDTQNDMCMMMSYTNLPSDAFRQMGSIPMMDALLKATVVCPANFIQGKIVADAKILFADSESEKMYTENIAYASKQNGNLVKFIPENSIATLGMNIRGVKMYNTFTAMPMYSQMLEALPQIKTIMEAIDGDVIISFNKMDATGKIPEATLIAELNDPAAVQNAMSMLAMMPVTQTAPYQYDFGAMGFNVSFGLQDKILYVTSDPVAASAIKGASIPSMEGRFGKTFNDSYGTFVIDFAALNAMLRTMIANRTIPQDVAQVLPVLQIFDTLESYAATKTGGSMTVNMTDREINSLDAIYHTIESMMAPFIAMAIVDSVNEQSDSTEEITE